MKLIIAGASGYVATEIVRQALSLPAITCVIALARRPVEAPANLDSGADASKLISVVVKDYGEYPEDVKAQLAGADACIWTVGITPPKARGVDFEHVRRVCHDHTFIGLKAMLAAASDKQFRFLYMSGAGGERDQSKKPWVEARYMLMRGETENQLLAFPSSSPSPKISICIAKPGFITSTGQYLKTAFSTILKYTISLPRIDVKECAAAMLSEAVNGFKKDTLENGELVERGRGVLGGGAGGK